MIMKTRYPLSGIALFLAMGAAIAQPADMAIAKVIYQFTHVDDSTQREKPRQEDMVLYLGKDGSLYRSIAHEESMPLLHQAKGGTTDTFDILEESAAKIFIDGKLHSVERIIDNMYIIAEEAPTIDWEVSDETGAIGGYTVQKATASFRGRDYTAWFAPEIPFPYGPWKLHGLPGLILAAEDSKEDVLFGYNGFETLKDEAARIAVPKSFNIQKVTQQEYNKVYKAFLADPTGFIKATTGAQNVVMGGRVGGGASKPKEYNNPIELSEN